MPQNKRSRDIQYPDPPAPGDPGYRTRAGRTGLDWVESRLELASMEGRFIRKLFTLQVRTRRPFHLALLIAFGLGNLLVAAAFIYFVIEQRRLHDWGRDGLSCIGFMFIVPALCFAAFTFANLYLTLREPRPPRRRQRRHARGR